MSYAGFMKYDYEYKILERSMGQKMEIPTELKSKGWELVYILNNRLYIKRRVK